MIVIPDERALNRAWCRLATGSNTGAFGRNDRRRSVRAGRAAAAIAAVSGYPGARDSNRRFPAVTGVSMPSIPLELPKKSLLPAAWDVPQEFRDRLGNKVGRQRAMVSGEQLLLVLHAAPQPNQDERVGRFFWRRADGTWLSPDFGSGTGALDRHLNEYADRLDKLEGEEEAAHSADEYFGVLDRLAPLRRSARNLHATLEEARRALPKARDLIDFRDRAYELDRRAELLYDTSQNALDFAVAKQAEAQARSANRMAVSAHRLNLLAAFFFPLATLSSVLGVNLKHTWEDVPGPGPFLGMVVVGLILGAVIAAVMTPPTDRNERTTQK